MQQKGCRFTKGPAAFSPYQILRPFLCGRRYSELVVVNESKFEIITLPAPLLTVCIRHAGGRRTVSLSVNPCLIKKRKFVFSFPYFSGMMNPKEAVCMIRVAVIGAGNISPAHIKGYLAFPDRCFMRYLSGKSGAKKGRVSSGRRTDLLFTS